MPAEDVSLGSRAEDMVADAEHNAAVKVQAISRGHGARKEQEQQAQAAVKVQAIARGRSSRREHTPEAMLPPSAAADGSDNVEIKPSHSAMAKALRPLLVALGLRSESSIYGFRPSDLGVNWMFFRNGPSTENWWEPVPGGHGHHGHHEEEHKVIHGHGPKTLFNTVAHHVPVVRHLWGDPQYEMHPGAQELFLDLMCARASTHAEGCLCVRCLCACVEGANNRCCCCAPAASACGLLLLPAGCCFSSCCSHSTTPPATARPPLLLLLLPFAADAPSDLSL